MDENVPFIISSDKKKALLAQINVIRISVYKDRFILTFRKSSSVQSNLQLIYRTNECIVPRRIFVDLDLKDNSRYVLLVS
jgi:hypothetical protein